jgi:WD repeat-containing protein 19
MKTLFTVQTNTLGRGPVFIHWNAPATHLAMVGATRRVLIYNRQGSTVATLSLANSGQVLALEWDSLGETLAVLQKGSSEIFLWDLNTKKSETVESNLKELTFMGWSKEGQILALGSLKGTLVLYNRKTLKMIPIKGKHTKKITDGCWSSNNTLALCSEDNTITLSNENGDTLIQTGARLPFDLKFSSLKKTGANSKQIIDTTLSAILDGKSLWLYDYTEKDEDPLELTFERRQEFGAISGYSWFGDGYLLIGFRSGHLVIISTHKSEIGQELSASKMADDISKVAYCEVLNKGACIGGNEVRCFDLSAISLDATKSDRVELSNEYGSLNEMQWTPDGQILTVASTNGNVYNFLTSIPMLYSAHETKVLHLTGLREFSITDVVTNQLISKFETEEEPTLCSLGDRYCAVGMNNRIWFYNYKGELVAEREVLGSAEKICVGYEFAGILNGGKVTLIEIEQRDDTGTKADDRSFPENDDGNDITCFAITPDFLVYATTRGSIYFYSLFDQTSVTEHRFDLPITHLFPNVLGTRVIVFDETHQASVYNPVDNSTVPIERLSGNVDKILWDLSDRNHFIACAPGSITSYIYGDSRTGPRCYPIKDVKNQELIMRTDIPERFQPILVNEGKVVCQQPSGIPVSVLLKSHELLTRKVASPHLTTEKFGLCLSMLKLDDAWNMANILNRKEIWLKLAQKSLEIMDLEMAVRVYRSMGDARMVMTIEKLLNVYEKNLIRGHLALIDKNFTEAEVQFWQSSQKHLALDMRRDLMHWDRALELAKKLGQEDQIAVISQEYASQLELKGEFRKAMELYESLGNSIAFDGMARCLIRLGNVSQGVKMAMENGSRKLCRDCALILMESKSYSEAAELFKKAEMYEKAAEIFISNKNYAKAAPLMKQIQNPKLLTMYAQAREKEGKYADAAEAYSRAGDWNAVVRLNLNHLNNAGKAIEIVRKSKSTEGATLIAQYCISTKNYKRAVEFLVLADKLKEAFHIAQTHDEMDTYAICVVNPTKEQMRAIAAHYEGKGQFEKAGNYYAMCEEIERAVSLLLQSGSEEAINKAIDIVGQSDNDQLIHQMVDFLMGNDGIAKNSKHIFRMYMALGNYEQASRTAADICKQQWEVGNYQVAHDILLDVIRQLIKKQLHIPAELKSSLLLLHSYLIVRDLAKLEQPMLSAKVLLRIAKNASRFPNHMIRILTSGVVYCYKAGLKKSAYEYATILARPENRKGLDEKNKKNIAQIVRKKRDVIDVTVPLGHCPNCRSEMDCWDTSCSNCKEDIPYCIVTGQHMSLNDWSRCPSCEFPALHSYFVDLLGRNGSECPMCKTKISDVTQVQKLSESDANQDLQKWLETSK